VSFKLNVSVLPIGEGKTQAEKKKKKGNSHWGEKEEKVSHAYANKERVEKKKGNRKPQRVAGGGVKKQGKVKPRNQYC